VIVGIPKEVKDSEYRVAATPEGVAELVAAGIRVVVQSTAGEGSALPDGQFVAAGADIAPDADAVFAQADMIVKVKEPQPQEYERFRPGTCSSRTCTWPPTSHSLARSPSARSPPSRTRPCRHPTAGCRCWRR
jgi:NAD/NADP transhydrogenase alpha subunit